MSNLRTFFDIDGDIDWLVISSDITAVNNKGYIVDTTSLSASGSITITLPLSASMGDNIGFMDIGSTFNSNNLIISGNGSFIEGVSGDITIDKNGYRSDLTYSGPTHGWLFGVEYYDDITNIANITTSLPLTISGGPSPVISINPSTSGSPGSMSASDKLKLDGMEYNATYNPTAEDTNNKNALNGYAGLVNGKINQDQLPVIAITNTFVISSSGDMLGLTAEVGDVAVRSDIAETYILQTEDPTELSHWVRLAVPVGSSTQLVFDTISVDGQSDIVADTTTDTLTFSSGSGINITTDPLTDTITFSSTPQDTFSTISVDWQDDIIASGTDTLVVSAGPGIDITTDPLTNTISISSIGLVTSIVSINTDVSNNNGYFVDTTSTPITMTLPVTATMGDIIFISDYAGNFSTNNCTIGRNGHKIIGLSEDLVLDMDHIGVSLMYADTTKGWCIS